MVNIASSLLLRSEHFTIHPYRNSRKDQAGLEGNTGKESENKNTVLKMITKEQIEQAAKEWARKMSNAPDKDTPDWIECDFMGGANWAIAQCPYSREDMMNFGQMCLAYMPIADGYCRRNNIGGEMPRNIREIFQKWEEQK